jgi:hypothetical protein
MLLLALPSGVARTGLNSIQVTISWGRATHISSTESLVLTRRQYSVCLACIHVGHWSKGRSANVTPISIMLFCSVRIAVQRGVPAV